MYELYECNQEVTRRDYTSLLKSVIENINRFNEAGGDKSVIEDCLDECKFQQKLIDFEISIREFEFNFDLYGEKHIGHYEDERLIDLQYFYSLRKNVKILEALIND